MLTIRMQRTGRKGHAMFRMVVQDSRVTPTSGKLVAQLGSYDPHAKTATIDKEKALAFLSNGAQPSERAARLLKEQGVKLPSWVKENVKKTGQIRNGEKLRKNRPAAETPVEAESQDASVEAQEPKEVAETETTDKPADDNDVKA